MQSKATTVEEYLQNVIPDLIRNPFF